MSVWKTVKNDVLGSNVNEKMLEAALADALYNMGGEVLNISDYIELEEGD